MKSRPNVRGRGKKDREIADLKQKMAGKDEVIAKQSALIDKQHAALGEAVKKIETLADALKAKHELKAKNAAKPARGEAKREYDIPERMIRSTANIVFREEGGEDYVACLESCRAKHRAFMSQVNASERDHGNFVEGPPGWGPTITPYEDRMNNAQIIKLKKEINTLMERCRQTVIEDIVRDIEEGRRDPETYALVRGAWSPEKGSGTAESAEPDPISSPDPVSGGAGTESGQAEPASEMERGQAPQLRGASPLSKLAPEPVIDFEITDELVAEWVKWQLSQGTHIPPYSQPVMAALQRAEFGGIPLPDKVAELMARMIETIEAEMAGEQIKAQPVRQSSPQAATAGVETPVT